MEESKRFDQLCNTVMVGPNDADAHAYLGMTNAFDEDLRNRGPVGPPAMAWNATAYHALGRRKEASVLADQVARRFPAFHLTDWNFFKQPSSSEVREWLFNQVRDAGISE